MSQLNTPVFGGYVDAMRITADNAQPCARELVNHAPADADPREKKALRRVGDRASEIDEVLKERERDPGVKVRPVVTAFCNGWGGLSDAMLGLTRIPNERGERAAALHARLFPAGMLWLREDARTIWSQGNRLVQRIDEENLAREIDQLIGADVREAVTRVTNELGETIGVGRKRRESVSTTGVQEKLLAFSRAVAFYCRQLAANVDESDPKSIERFRLAVAPIDAYRSTRTVRDSEPPRPEAPAIDPVTPDPVADES
ncbi:hypothetical protein [Sandaracinus amylolyticus]|uniref:Uncharacterized protein n=1 Tax=Sandaracinus amylolyticus TaxID=927083 RepID=A0A0F6YL65_9BACT|nr:hypothetical protein [Sandaracinus amylolyticus]AKF08978.1 hypothetical protein DB32_006127 [Sandaracinus amylolyticus]